MAEKEEDLDPFASIIDQCKYSSSQEDLLRYCLFCRESQEGLLAFSSQESLIPEEEELQVAASQGLIICSPPDTQPEEEEEELQVAASQGLIICSAPDTQPEEEEEEELQGASQGMIICSAPDTQPEEEEEFQTPEERLLLVSSEEQWMDLDENVESSKIDGAADCDTDVFDDGDLIGSGGYDASLDLDDTVELGNDSYVNFSEENNNNSVAGNNGSPMMMMPKAAVRVDGDDDDDNSVPLVEEKSSEGNNKFPIEILPLQQCLGIPEPMMTEGLGFRKPMMTEEGLGFREPMMTEGLGLPEPMCEGLEPLNNEGLGIPKVMSEGLDDTLSKNLISSEMKLQLLVVDNVDSSVGRSSREICLGGGVVVEKTTIESPVEKKLGSSQEDLDPFVSIIDQCKYSSSQEGLLAFSTQESSLPEEEEELQVAASQGLIICSPPDTQPEEEEEEDLQVASQGLIICSAPDTQPEEEELQVASQGLIICSAPDTQPEEEELQVASQGLIICSAPDTQPEEEEEEEGLLGGVSQGLIICSAPDTQPEEEEFKTPEERLLLVSSEEQWMDLDENVESKIDGGDCDTDVFDDGDLIGSGGYDASLDLDDTVDLGNDSYVNFSEENNSVAGNGSPMMPKAAVRVDGDNKSVPLVEKSPEGKVPIEILPLQQCLGLPELMIEGLGLPELMIEGLGLPEPMMTEGLGLPEPMGEGLEPLNEGLRLPEVMSEGLDNTLSKNLITSEMHLQLLVVDNVDSSVGSREICLGGVVEKTIESPVEEKIGSLKSRCNSPSISSPKSPQKSQKIATHENVDDVNAHSDMYFEKDDKLVVHPVTNEVEVLEIAVGNNSGVLMCCTDAVMDDAVMEDATPIAINKGLVPEISIDKVLDLDNPQTDVVHKDEGKRSSYNMEGLGEVEKTGTSDILPQSEDPPELRKLPNWVGGKDNAMRSLRKSGKKSGKKRAGGADCFSRRGIHRVGEVEDSGCGGGRVVEVDGIGCGAGRVEEVEGIDTGRRLREGTGLGQGGKTAGCSSKVTEVLSSGKEYDAMMNLLAATFLRENDRNAGNGHGGGRVEEAGGSDNDGRKLGEEKGSGSHGKEVARVTGTGHGGGRVEEVDGSANAGRRLGEGKGSGSHGKKTAGEAEGSSRVASALSSGNPSQAMMNFLTASFLREPNVNKGNADNSNENSQNTEDILEVAIRAGLKFPRPRWWKPEGYETKRYN